ncbi:MAG: leucine-rich repeat domain-containing protein [Cytophagales bacterium]|nr:MAG: leucine-rich repeat domain-containing protein [Cytophagales bacterium]
MDIGNVLRDFLEEQVTIIAKDLQQSPETLWKILSPFATLEGTKEPLSLENLQGKLPELPPHLLDQAVEKFANVRILRYTEKDALYEVSHDTLAKQIAAKRSDEEIALLEIDRLIKNQLAFGKDLFSEKQLDIILPYQNKLKLTKEEIKLIYDSQTKLQRQQKGQKQRTRNERIGVAIFVIILLRVSIFALWQWQITEDALDFAKTMQTKMETAVFDKAVKNRFPEWKSYSNYNSNNSQEKAERDKILGQIDSLDLSGNALTALPQELAQCPRLTHLNLLQNPEIDWTSMQRLKGLPQLHSIYVSVNDLSAIDSSYWKQITGVEILQNGLTAIPENLLAQQQLRYLDLSADRGYDNRNQFFPLPPTLFALQNLNYLNLGSCQIKELPAEIRQLKNLTTLDLRNNQLSRLPVEIGQLKNLTVLRLSGNQLSRLPVEIGQLKNLTVSTLNNNPLSSEQINQTLWLLPNIERLFLGDLGLNQLPEAVFQLSKLKELYLTNYDEDKKNPNTFSEEEKTKIKKLLPNCYVQF